MASLALQAHPSRLSCRTGGVRSFQAPSLGLGWTSHSQFCGRVPITDCDPVGVQTVALGNGKLVSSTGSVFPVATNVLIDMAGFECVKRIKVDNICLPHRSCALAGLRLADNPHLLTEELDEKAAKLHLTTVPRRASCKS